MRSIYGSHDVDATGRVGSRFGLTSEELAVTTILVREQLSSHLGIISNMMRVIAATRLPWTN